MNAGFARDFADGPPGPGGLGQRPVFRKKPTEFDLERKKEFGLFSSKVNG